MKAAPKEKEPKREQAPRAAEEGEGPEEGGGRQSPRPKEAKKEKEDAARAILQKAAGKEKEPAVETVPAAPEKEKVEKEPRLLFNRWDLNEVEVTDPGLKRYINLHSMIVPHSSGKFTKQQFAKGEMLIVERLINGLMQTEMNTGQKQRAIRITKDAFETIYKKTKKNPVQVLVDAISQAGPREETVRLKYGGINVPKSVDTAPLRQGELGPHVHLPRGAMRPPTRARSMSPTAWPTSSSRPRGETRSAIP